MFACKGSSDKLSDLAPLDSADVVADSISMDVKIHEKSVTVVSDSLFLADSIESSVQHASGLVIYLTFDDGPYHTTPAIASILKNKQVKGSFFVVGSQRDRVAEYDSIYRFMVSDSLFRFYNHTYSHAITFGRLPKYYSKPDQVLADLERNRLYIPAGSKHIRLPGKNTWWTAHRVQMDGLTKQIIAGLKRQGINDRIIGWDVSWKQTKGKEMVDSLILKIVKVSKRNRPFKNHVVVLCHDYQFGKKEALADLSYFIDQLRKKHGCIFAWAEEFPD
ncbi:MAG: polysaccharide deacetylase family protein [Bacteroidota bacterium]